MYLHNQEMANDEEQAHKALGQPVVVRPSSFVVSFGDIQVRVRK
jgi:hypothetical protein